MRPRAWILLTAVAALCCLWDPAFSAELKLGRSDPRKIIAENPEAGKLIEVPFIAQERDQCGPASLAMILGHHGIEADPNEIYKKFETKAVAGVFTLDLLIAATEAGVKARWVEGEIEDLNKEIDQARPVIVFLNLLPNPLPARHFAVALGYIHHRGRDHIVIHSGPDPYLMVPEKKFKRQWKRTGNLMMTIKPEPADQDGEQP